MAPMGRCLALLALLLTGCGPASPPSPAPPPATDGPAVYAPQAGIAGEVTVAFALPAAPEEPAAGGFVRAMPWPSELWRRPDGRLDFRDFPGADSFLVGRAVAESEAEVTAFAVNPVVFFHLSGAIDPSRLPPPAADPSPTGRVALLDVDPESPERGRAVPLEHRWYGEAQRFVPANTLAIKPLAGFVLRPATLYAAVVHRDLGAPPLGTSRDLELTKWTQPHPEPAAERARRLHGPALDLLTQEGVPRSAVAALAVFRTGRPTAVTEAMIAVSARLGPPRQPRLLRAEWLAGHTPPDRGFRVIRGYYCTPSFQREIDAVPFVERGGTVVLDRDGQPQLQPIPTTSPFRTDECGDLLRARFVLTVPTTPMPAAGWPLLVTAHGTTGSALSLTDVDNFAGWAAREGIAAVSTDQPLHGGDDPVSARPGSRKPFKLKFGGIPIRIPHEG